MVQDDGQVGDGFGEICQLGELREVQPSLEGQPPPGQHPRAGTERVTRELLLYSVRGRVVDLGVGVPRHRMADTTKPVGTGCL